MGIFDALDHLVRSSDPRTVRPANPADWPTLNEPLDAGEESFDLGATVDDTNLDDAGGYPAAVPADLGSFRPEPSRTSTPTSTPAAPCGCKDKHHSPVIEWKSARYSFAATDTQPVIVTPSGADTPRVLCVSLVASVAGFRVGPTSNDAQAGARLPFGLVLQVYAGPVWIANPDGAAGTVDVFVEYEPAS